VILITSFAGTPTENEWPGMKSLPDYFDFTIYPPNPLRSIFTAASADALDLLDQSLNYNPLSRPDALACLKHAYFSNMPRPTRPDKLPKGSFAPITASNKRKADDDFIDDEDELNSNSRRVSKVAKKLF
jgi:cyclin-dependent kinase 7